MNPNETSECIYLNVQCMNPSQTNSNSLQAVINQRCNPIVKNLADYNVYLQSMTLTTSDLPFINMRRYIQWDNDNFLDNKTNMCVTFVAGPGDYPFVIPAPSVTLYGLDQDPGTNNYNGVVSFITFYSENSTLPNPGNPGWVSSASYPRGYFNVHSIGLFLNYINNAINAALNTMAGTPYNNQMYFYYDPQSQLYGLKVPDAIKTDLSFYANSFCEKYIDAFRWHFVSNSDVSLIIGYTGMDYYFVWNNYPFNKDADDVWTYTAEYNTVSALCDTHSIIITTPNGSLSTLRQQYLPATNSMQNNIDLPMVPALKNIDIDFTSLQFSTINNSFIQYESSGLFFPVNGLAYDSLDNINIVVNIMTIDNYLYPVNIPAGGYANVKFVLCKKKKTIN